MWHGLAATPQEQRSWKCGVFPSPACPPPLAASCPALRALCSALGVHGSPGDPLQPPSGAVRDKGRNPVAGGTAGTTAQHPGDL